MGMLETLRGRWAVRQRRVLGASHKSDVITTISKTFRAWAQSMMLAAGAYLEITHEINPGLMMAGSILLGCARAPIDQMIGSWKGLVAARVQYQRLNETLGKLSLAAEDCTDHSTALEPETVLTGFLAHRREGAAGYGRMHRV